MRRIIIPARHTHVDIPTFMPGGIEQRTRVSWLQPGEIRLVLLPNGEEVEVEREKNDGP